MVTDPRAAQIERLKAEIGTLKERVARRDTSLAKLTAFRTLAVSRLAAQHEEITRLREQLALSSNVTRLPTATRPEFALAAPTASRGQSQ